MKSALAYKGNNLELKENLSNKDLVQSGFTEFDNYYIPSENQEHIQITKENYEFILSELNNPLLPRTPIITGDNKICGNDIYSFSVNNLDDNNTNYNINWSVSNGLEIVGSSHNKIINIRKNGNFYGDKFLSVEYGNLKSTLKLETCLEASFYGDSSVNYNKTGTWSATARYGTPPYTFEWFLSKEGESGVLVSTNNPLTLKSVPSNTNNYNYLEVSNVNNQIDYDNETISTQQISQPIGGSTNTYVLFIRVSDQSGDMIITPTKRIVCYGNAKLIPDNGNGSPLPFMIMENENNGTIETYPNPVNNSLRIKYIPDDATSDELSLSSSSLANKAITFSLYDNMFMLVKSSTINKNSITWNVSNIRNGTYYLHYSNGSIEVKKQIIIKHD